MTKKIKLPWLPKSISVDANVASLVLTINDLPGLSTRSSCGGHKKITNACQQKEGSWQVTVDIDRTSYSFDSIELITAAVQILDAVGDVLLIPWTEGGPFTLSFDLSGNGKVSADHLDRQIKKMLK